MNDDEIISRLRRAADDATVGVDPAAIAPLSARSRRTALLGAGGVAITIVALVVALSQGRGAAVGAADHSGGAGTSGAVVASGSAEPTSATASGCPEQLTAEQAHTVPAFVPVAPEGVPGGDGLVPAGLTPTHVEVCEYLPPTPATHPVALGRHRTLAPSQFVDLVASLGTAVSGDPRGMKCLHNARSARYLIRLDHPAGRVWIGTGNGCSGSTNGVFTSTMSFAPSAQAALLTGQWADASYVEDECTDPIAALEPRGAWSLTEVTEVGVCRHHEEGASDPAVWLEGSDRDALLTRLRDLHPDPSNRSTCSGSSTSPGVFYRLRAARADGSSTYLTIDPRCEPMVTGHGLGASASQELADWLDGAVEDSVVAPACPPQLQLPSRDTTQWQFPPLDTSSQNAPGDALVPRATPRWALICSYVQTALGERTAHLRDGKALSGSLAAIPGDLRAVRFVDPATVDCPGPTYPVVYRYLWLGYPDTEPIWVGTSTFGCDGTTNGRYRTATTISDTLAASLEVARWVGL